MTPKLPETLLEKLHQSGQSPPWRCRLRLRRGRLVFAVEIAGNGEILSVDGRAVYGPSDISFNPVTIEDVAIS